MTLWTKIGLVVISILFATFSGVPTAHAVTYPGKNGDITYSQISQGTANVWTVQNGKTHPRQLTYFGAKSPVWSPDGQRMVVVSLWGQLYILDKQGNMLTPLPYAAGFQDDTPTWSPDGKRIAFVRTQSGSNRSAIMSIVVQTHTVTTVSGWLSAGGYRSPSWAPDSQRLVYEKSASGQKTLLIKNIANGNLRQLTTLSDDVASDVAWSPNGKKLLYNDSADQVYTIWADGSHRSAISDGDSRSAAWSPDGTTIAFVEDDSISLSEPDGTVAQLYAGDGNHISYLSWSPDGSRIAFINNAATGASHIDAFDITAKTTHRIASPTSQPDTLSWQAKP